MKRSCRIIAAVIMVLVIFNMLTACGKETGKTTTGNKTNSTSVIKTTKKTGTASSAARTGTSTKSAIIGPSATTSPGTDVGEIEPDEDEYKEVTYDFGGRTFIYRTSSGWQIKDDHAHPLWRTLSASLEEASTKYNCKVEYQDMINLNEMVAALMAGLYIGDFTMNSASYRVLPTWMNAGIIMPLDDIIDFSDPLISKLPHEITKFGGLHWGFLWQETKPGPHLIYNKDLTSREGIPDLFTYQQDGTWTWDKMLEVAIATTRDFNGDGITDQWGFDNLDTYAKLCWTTVISNEGRIYEWNDSTSEFELSVYNRNTLSALQFLSDLVHIYKVASPVKLEWGGNSSRYFLGLSAMAHWTNYNMSRLALCPQNSGFVVFPKGPNASDYSADTTTWFINVFSNAKNPDEVGKFISRAFVTWDPDKEAYYDHENALAETQYFFSDNDKISYRLAADKMVDIVKGVQGTPGFMAGNLFSLLKPELTIGGIASIVGESELILRNNVTEMNEAVKTALDRLGK